MKLPVNDSIVEFKIGTGADITVMSQTAFNRLHQSSRLVPARKIPLVTSPGGKVQSIGKFLAKTKEQNYHYWVTVINRKDCCQEDGVGQAH